MIETTLTTGRRFLALLAWVLMIATGPSIAFADDATIAPGEAPIEEPAATTTANPEDGQLDGSVNSDPVDSKSPSPTAKTEKPKPPKSVMHRDYEIFYSLVYSRYEYNGKKWPLRGDLYRPAKSKAELTTDEEPTANSDTEPLPVVLLIHGGGWTSGSKTQMLLHAKKLAKRGYAAFAISYRFAPKHKFPAQAHDCKSAVRWLRRNAKQFNLDPHRVAAYGYSAGAHLSCLLGTTDPSHGLEGQTANDEGRVEGIESAHPISTRVQAVVGGGTPCDFRHMPPDRNFLTYWLGGTRHDKPKLYELASPATHVSPDDPPMFFFNGDEDWLVPMHNTQAMMRRLKEAGIRTGLHVCEGKGHINTFADNPSAQAAIDFLDSEFKPKVQTD